MKSISVLLLSLLVSVGAFAFSADQNQAQLKAEVAQRAAVNKAQGMSDEDSAKAIAKAAAQAGANLASVRAAMTSLFSATVANAAIVSALTSTAVGPAGGGGGGDTAIVVPTQTQTQQTNISNFISSSPGSSVSGSGIRNSGSPS